MIFNDNLSFFKILISSSSVGPQMSSSNVGPQMSVRKCRPQMSVLKCRNTNKENIFIMKNTNSV